MPVHDALGLSRGPARVRHEKGVVARNGRRRYTRGDSALRLLLLLALLHDRIRNIGEERSSRVRLRERLRVRHRRPARQAARKTQVLEVALRLQKRGRGDGGARRAHRRATRFRGAVDGDARVFRGTSRRGDHELGVQVLDAAHQDVLGGVHGCGAVGGAQSLAREHVHAMRHVRGHVEEHAVERAHAVFVPEPRGDRGDGAQQLAPRDVHARRQFGDLLGKSRERHLVSAPVQDVPIARVETRVGLRAREPFEVRRLRGVAQRVPRGPVRVLQRGLSASAGRDARVARPPPALAGVPPPQLARGSRGRRESLRRRLEAGRGGRKAGGLRRLGRLARRHPERSGRRPRARPTEARLFTRAAPSGEAQRDRFDSLSIDPLSAREIRDCASSGLALSRLGEIPRPPSSAECRAQESAFRFRVEKTHAGPRSTSVPSSRRRPLATRTCAPSSRARLDSRPPTSVASRRTPRARCPPPRAPFPRPW